MLITVVFVGGIFGTGCQNPRALLKTSREQVSAVRLKEVISSNEDFKYISLGRRSAREISGYGLIGLAIGSIAQGASQRGSDVISTVGKSINSGEALRNAVQTLLLQHRLASGSPEAGELDLRLMEHGLLEEQPGYFVPYGWASATLRTASGQKVWSATVYSQGEKARVASDYKSRPESYREDFNTVAADLARQLIEGPVRNRPARY